MYKEPRIIALGEKKLIAKRLSMSLSADKTFELWRSFMPEQMQIRNRVNADLFSMRVYHETMQPGNISQQFNKWAAVEVSDFDDVPPGMESFVLSPGLYAVFDYKGLNTDSSIFSYIFQEWLPTSGYELQERPHFEILGSKYKNNDPESEEEIWIPVRKKG